MRSIFAQHGISKVVFSDNRPKYSSQKFKTFSKSWDSMQRTFSSKFPQSNRFREGAIQSNKKTLRKMQ